ncbi:MAG: hypothetical protein HYS13_24130 [Planctomycetia bacterium]|nr:hypothetical protein [Planctomycetia bacterium]
MKRLVVLPLLAIVLGCGSGNQATPPPGGSSTAGHDHAGDHAQHQGHATSSLIVQTEPKQPKAGEPAKLKLMIHETSGKMVMDFQVVHEHKIHLIVVHDGLDQFDHVHPEVEPTGHATIDFTFPTGGTYWLYADYQPAGGEHATAMGEVAVDGPTPAAPALEPNVPGRVTTDALDAEITMSAAAAAGEPTIDFALFDKSGQKVTDLEPYLGERGHLAVISRDGKEYIHAHPLPDHDSAANVVIFQAHLGKPGLYKGWGQFKRGGKVIVVPFVLNVP